MQRLYAVVPDPDSTSTPSSPIGHLLLLSQHSCPPASSHTRGSSARSLWASLPDLLSFTRLPCTVILEFCSVELAFSNTSGSSDRSTSSSGSRHQQTPSSQNPESPRSAWRHPRSPSVPPFRLLVLRDRNLMVDIPLHAYLQRVLPLQLCSWLQRRRSCCCWRCSALAVLGMSPPSHRRPSSC